jgi:hypothetical protein
MLIGWDIQQKCILVDDACLYWRLLWLMLWFNMSKKYMFIWIIYVYFLAPFISLRIKHIKEICLLMDNANVHLVSCMYLLQKDNSITILETSDETQNIKGNTVLQWAFHAFQIARKQLQIKYKKLQTNLWTDGSCRIISLVGKKSNVVTMIH